MDVKELRIGNLVKDDECIIVVVEALSGDNALVNGYGENEVLFSKKGYPNVLFESEIHPIELTEELLFKCGFEKVMFNNNTANWNKHPVQIFWNISNGFEYFHGQLGGKFVKLNTLHQLQNLYFALTGKELDVLRIIEK